MIVKVIDGTDTRENKSIIDYRNTNLGVISMKISNDVYYDLDGDPIRD